MVTTNSLWSLSYTVTWYARYYPLFCCLVNGIIYKSECEKKVFVWHYQNSIHTKYSNDSINLFKYFFYQPINVSLKKITDHTFMIVKTILSLYSITIYYKISIGHNRQKKNIVFTICFITKGNQEIRRSLYRYIKIEFQPIS